MKTLSISSQCINSRFKFRDSVLKSDTETGFNHSKTCNVQKITLSNKLVMHHVLYFPGYKKCFIHINEYHIVKCVFWAMGNFLNTRLPNSGFINSASPSYFQRQRPVHQSMAPCVRLFQYQSLNKYLHQCTSGTLFIGLTQDV